MKKTIAALFAVYLLSLAILWRPVEAAPTGNIFPAQNIVIGGGPSDADGGAYIDKFGNGYLTGVLTALGGITGFSITSPVAGQFLVHDGTNFVNKTMSGDATVASSGALTISNGAVSLAKQADMATASVIYRKTAGTGVPEVQPLATLKTDLGLTGTNSGDQTITLTGDVTGSGAGSFAATIANNAVTLAKIADMATASLLGRNTAGTGDPEVLSAATAKSLLSLNNVENTALSTWAGTSNITTLGTIGAGTWNATAIGATKGGTGLTTATQGDLLYASGDNTWAKLPKSTTAGQFLTNSGAANGPAWASPKTEAIVLWAGDAIVPQTNPAGTPTQVADSTTNKLAYVASAYTNSSTINLQWTRALPDRWNGTATYRVGWFQTVGSTACTWTLSGVAIGSGEAMDAAPSGSAAAAQTAATSNYLYETVAQSVTFAGTPAAGEMIQFKLTRNTASANTVYAVFVKVEYAVNAY